MTATMNSALVKGLLEYLKYSWGCENLKFPVGAFYFTIFIGGGGGSS